MVIWDRVIRAKFSREVIVDLGDLNENKDIDLHKALVSKTFHLYILCVWQSLRQPHKVSRTDTFCSHSIDEELEAQTG